MSAHAHDPDIERAMKVGMNDYRAKPVTSSPKAHSGQRTLQFCTKVKVCMLSTQAVAQSLKILIANFHLLKPDSTKLCLIQTKLHDVQLALTDVHFDQSFFQKVKIQQKFEEQWSSVCHGIKCVHIHDAMAKIQADVLLEAMQRQSKVLLKDGLFVTEGCMPMAGHGHIVGSQIATVFE